MERNKLILVVLSCAAILAALFLPKFSELQKLRESKRDSEERMAILRQQNDILKEKIKKLISDPAYVEQEARQKLGIIKKGEYIYGK